MRDTHAIATPQPIWLGELNKTVDLAPADFGNNVIVDMRRPDPIHDQAQSPRRPSRGVPLQLDQHEGVAGKERRPILDGPTEARPPIPQPRVVGFISVQAQTVQRQGLTIWLEA